MNVISTLFGLLYQLANRLYDGVSGISHRVWQERTWIGDVRLCGYGRIGVAELRDPSGAARYKVLRAESMQDFRWITDQLRLEGWKAWASNAAEIELISAIRRAGQLRLAFPRNRGVQADLDDLVGIVLAEQQRRSNKDGFGPIIEAAAANG